MCVQVKYTGYRDRPVEERRRRFLEDLQEGHSVIVSSSVPTTNTSLYCLSPQTFIATGANLNLQFCGSALQDEKPPNCRPSKDTVDLESEPGKVRGHLAAPCMQWLYNTSLH